MAAMGKAEFGSITFCASRHPSDKCGANGLPLTPNSIRIQGRFQMLKGLQHPRLCKYLDLVRSKHERLIVVFEYYKNNLATAIKTGKYTQLPALVNLAYQVLEGLAFLNSHGLVHRSLSAQNVLLDSQGGVKLANYGMYYMTGCGTDVCFPVGCTRYLAPEVLTQGPVRLQEVAVGEDEWLIVSTHSNSGPKTDSWSLGILLVQALLGDSLWSTLTLQQTAHKILGFLKTDVHPLDTILRDHHAEEKIKKLPEELVLLLRNCLNVQPRDRPTPTQLMQFAVFRALRETQVPYRNGFSMFSVELRSLDLDLPSYDDEDRERGCEDPLSERHLQEVYYLWRLAGGDLEGILRKAGLIRTRPPVTKLASFIVEPGEVFGEYKDQSMLLDETVTILSQEQLRQRLEKIDEAAYYPLLEDESCEGQNGTLPNSPSTADLTETTKLPLIIREKDVEYQFHRLMLYERLLKAYPYKRADIWKEARVDIPPLVRGQVWAALLDVEGDVYGRYDAIDKETPTPTDRQIEVDIPRCHQYNELLSSPVGHAKLKRLLKAWVVSHPHYVYWQGLDSLCAPFLFLNFNDEAVAYACLKAFIPKYLHKFFLKDNSKVIQEYLAVFSHLIAFHDPELSNHLDGIGFIPDLYAIPWFLTMYAHAFPLHRILHLWDTLLLGNSSFPLFIGVAILQQLRDQLLSFGFNECILLFSDMPQIDIEKCVQESIRIFCATPKSACYRQHAQQAKGAGEKDSSRPTVSYYSQDYNEVAKNDMSMEPVSLEDLKAEKCARISAQDLLELSELRGSAVTRSPTKRNKQSKPKLVIIDVRSQEEYLRGTVPGSINIPFGSAFTPEGKLTPCPAVQTLDAHRSQVKVIIGSRGKNAVHFAEALVRLDYSKVCVLHRGLDALRPAGILTVPNLDQ